jgi:FMN phosphatase YigB (HAD superfamily)
VIRTERRIGILGKIQRYFRKLDSLYDRGTWDDEHEDPIESLKEDLLEIIELLENERDRQLILTNSPPEVIDRLPRPLPPPLHGYLDLAVIREEDE